MPKTATITIDLPLPDDADRSVAIGLGCSIARHGLSRAPGSSRMGEPLPVGSVVDVSVRDGDPRQEHPHVKRMRERIAQAVHR